MFKLKKIATAVVFAISVSLSTASNAVIAVPSIDIANLAENIAGNIQSAYQWAQEKVISMAQMDLSQLLSQNEMDSMNNAMANVIVRVNKAMEDIHNQKVVEMAVPDRDICKTMAIKLVMDDIYCALDDSRATSNANKAAAAKAATAASGSASEFQKYTEDQINKMHTSCTALGSGGGKTMADTPCGRVENVTQGAVLGASAAERAKTRKASELAIQNMTGQNEPRIRTNPNLPDSVATRASVAKDLRFENYKALAINSLEETNRMIQAAEGKEDLPTPMEAMQAFDMDRFGSETWMEEVSNTGANKLSNPVSQTELMRKMLAMDAFNIHLNLLQYEHQLRMEKMAAAQLDIKLDPVSIDK